MLSTENRLRVISLLFILFALLLVGKLYLLQIIEGDEFRAKAEHQYVAGVSYFDRGSIFFTAKDGTLVPGATVATGYTLSINPTLMGDMDVNEVYEKLNAVVPIADKDLFLVKAHKFGDPYEEILDHLTEPVAVKLQALKIPGVSVASERWRAYPGKTMAAHALGLIGYGTGDEANQLAGRYGLERFYEDTLKREGDEVFVNFFAEIFSNLRAVAKGDNLEGDVVTTIEPSVEAFLEREIDAVTSQYSSEFTGGIVIDPQTGAVLAMALTPTFDPNTPQDAESSAVFTNKLVESRYEMGSIVKSLTYAIGLEEGAITPTTTYNDPGCMTLNTKTFCNYDQQSHGTAVTMQNALGQSLNTGAAWVALKVGAKKFDSDLLKFGLDEKTGIDLPSEGNSLVSNLKTGRDLEAATASFGQGIALTPIQTVRALSAVANGGTLVTPHLTKEIKYKIGTSKTISYPSLDARPRAISEETSAEISRMLVEVVDRSLRNGTMALANYSIAAKTGTAQIAAPTGGYYPDRYLHSFFGYFPAYNPQFLVFLFTYYPKNVQYASETLTDAFFNTAKFIINYYQVPPDRTKIPDPNPAFKNY
jgi:cell division protein FtsI/penicillin-binding protein 2